MELREIKALALPDTPGVYMFLGANKEILYIGKATSLRDRVRSYFGNDLLHTRGKHIVDMVTLARTVTFTVTDSVLEAVILEAANIKKYQPSYNTKEKDNKSFNYVVITNEHFPRVLILRERTMLVGGAGVDVRYRYVFGPFPQGTNLSAAMKIIRKLFPYRDKCAPDTGKACFDHQIGLCPGVCVGAFSEKEYAERIRDIKLFFEGKRSAIVGRLKRKMHTFAERLEFEKANEIKKMIFGLEHIKDVSLISDEIRSYSQRSSQKRSKVHRIEAYDVAHISGKYTVGVMVVVENGRPKPSGYRKFKIRIDSEKPDDVLHLEEVLRRRFAHTEWEKPDLVVIDGGVAQKRIAMKVLKELMLDIAMVSVVKDERHKPRAILGDKEVAESYRHGILIANAESHRFAVAYHRQLRDRIRR